MRKPRLQVMAFRLSARTRARLRKKCIEELRQPPAQVLRRIVEDFVDPPKEKVK